MRSGLGTLDPELSTRSSKQGLSALPLPTSPLKSHYSEKCVCKSFGMHTYKTIGLKVPWNDILTKKGGEGGASSARLYLLYFLPLLYFPYFYFPYVLGNAIRG